MWRAAEQHPGQAGGHRNRQVPKILAVAVVGGAFAVAATWSWGDRWGLQADGADTAFVCDLKGDWSRQERGSLEFNRMKESTSMLPHRSRRKELLQPAQPAKILPYGSRKREEWNPITQWEGEKIYHPVKLQDDKYRQWYHFNADGKSLNKLAVAISYVLRGKLSVLYDPGCDVGAFAVVTNCERVRVHGKQYHYKIYIRNIRGTPSGLRVERFCDLLKRFPERIIMKAVWECMPKTMRNRRIFKERLKLFAGPNHLYYHKDPVEYPMHKIPDVTFDQAVRHRDRYDVYHTKVKPREEKLKAWRQGRRERTMLRLYKCFLRAQLWHEGIEGAERDNLDQLAARAEERRLNKVLTETEGKTPPKPVKKIFWKTYIPVAKRYSGSKAQRRPA
eukprot:TRINITY_DN76904_c0_g1_i1.p1 TRINITY_DN76904_c0_g1~~TRINITY_DN76904_c0_g1_i1.p1  ORF type:complete len:406 (+),score=56.72 TRINITY_DN76904_c0_g1_i1:49-1218(+)